MRKLKNYIKKIRQMSFEHWMLIAVFLISIGGGIIFGYVNVQVKNFAGIDNLRKFQPSVPTRLYDINGELISELFLEKRDLVAYQDLPQSLINSFLAAEDKNFFNHFGLAPLSIVRAMGKNIIASIKDRNLTVTQGGSTITQQLAKRLFTTGERRLSRKILEMILTLQIEKMFTKEQIFEMYINQIYLGHGCHGIESASQFFFNKNSKHLTVIESSILASLPSRPNGFSPLRFPRESSQKNRDTLNRMVRAGFLDEEKSQRIFIEFWPKFFESLKTEYPTKTAATVIVDKAPHFTDYVRQILTAQFGRDMVYNEGLNVYTTLDLKRQKVAEQYLVEGVTRQNAISARLNTMYTSGLDRSLFSVYEQLRMIFNLPGVSIRRDIDTIFKRNMVDNHLDSLDILALLVDSPQVAEVVETFRTSVSGISTALNVEGAMIAIEPSTGYITSMVGGSEYSVSNQFNRAVQARRQPGSAFKPFVYGAGIESKGINVATVLPDAPIMDMDALGSTWVPSNYDGDFVGMVGMRRALAASINIISVRIFDLIGADKIIDHSSRMLKVHPQRFTPTPALSLGASELTPLEMATGYAIYANRGRDVIPFAVRFVTDQDGNVISNTEEEVGRAIAIKELNGSIQVISPQVAYIMTSMMQDVASRGTAAGALRDANFLKKSAGKTGTTSNWTDAWFCGYTSDIAAVVWVGYDRPFMSLGRHQSGSGLAAPIWANYMREVYNGMPNPVFPARPPGISHSSVCRYTGLIPGPMCREFSSDIGLPGSGAARQVCDGQHFRARSILDMYLEREGLTSR